MPKIKSSIACNLDKNILLASLPLFHSDKVQAIEWSFDALFRVKNIPEWFVELLKEFSAANRLIGHGVFFSLFSGKWSSEQDAWLQHLKKVSGNFNFEHISEHFGFMTGENFHQGAPISIPFTKSTVAIGQDRLKRIYNACECPVGLENLAFAYSMDEVKKHGDFLEKLLDPINGFIILDLHNLYCHLHNFQVSFEELIELYPVDRVREIHISGGSWEDSSIEIGKTIRRDTHDDKVPEEVFVLLEKAIPLCRNLEYVTLEQLGVGLNAEESRIDFQKDFFRMDDIVEKANASALESNNNFRPEKLFNLGEPIQDPTLYRDQLALSEILENATGYQDAKDKLSKSDLANSSWRIENWEPAMLETVMAIAQKWK